MIEGSKNRMGYRHPGCRLTDDQVREARRGGTPAIALARRWGVTRDTIYRARDYINYRDVPDDPPVRGL